MSHSQNGIVQSGHQQPECTLEEAADRIAASAAPVLFPDTCSLVDLIRLPNPDRTNRSDVADCERELAAALALSEDQKEGDLWVVVPPLVPREYREHAIMPRVRCAKNGKGSTIRCMFHFSLVVYLMFQPASLRKRTSARRSSRFSPRSNKYRTISWLAVFGWNQTTTAATGHTPGQHEKFRPVTEVAK